MASRPEFIGLDGETMVPLRCELCGDQVGVKQPDFPMENVVVRCYSCAAVEEAEAITKGSA